MIGNKKLLAVIPARGGSKRLPRKNILDLSGKPMISWTIDAALGSKYIDRIVVSTDDQEIAKISKDCGADIPFIRPLELATDYATSIDVVLNLIESLERNNEYYDYIMLLQPTSPLRSTKNINESVELLKLRKTDAVVSVCKAKHSPLWCNTIPENGNLSGFLDNSILNKRSQDLEQYFCINGAIYLCNIKRLKQEKTFFLNSSCTAYKMNRESSVDIDSRMDFLYASVCINNGI